MPRHSVHVPDGRGSVRARGATGWRLPGGGGKLRLESHDVDHEGLVPAPEGGELVGEVAHAEQSEDHQD